MWVMQVRETDHLDCVRWYSVATKPTAAPYRFASAEAALAALREHYPRECRDVCVGCCKVRVRDEETGEVKYPPLESGQ
jgi:hypothetical protein